MVKSKSRKLFVPPMNKNLPAVYHNPTVKYDPSHAHYNATRNEISRYAEQIKINNPKVANKLLASGTLRAFAAEQLATYGPAILQWGANKAGDFIAGAFNNSGTPLIGNPVRRTPGGGANVTVSKVFDGKANPVSNTSYALSPAPNPKPISLNSAIKPNTFVNDYMPAMENKCSPLHFTNVVVQIPTLAANPLSGYFTNTIVFDIQTRAQEAVGFGIDIVNTLSSANLVTAFNALLNALGYYYYYSSILTYESDSSNNNSGMIFCRQKIDASTLSDYYQLKRRLEDTPCPPRLLQFMRYINSNFLSSNTQGAPIIKIAPHSNCYYTTQSPSALSNALDSLNTATNTAVFALLRKCIPSWRIGKLYDVPVTPVFDKNFLTIWANLPSCTMPVATPVFGNTVTNSTTSAPYNCYNNNLDGVAFACAGVYDTVMGGSYPGIVAVGAVNGTYRDNRQSFYQVASGTPQFYPVKDTTFLALCRQETVPLIGGTYYTPHLFGTDKCQNVTGAALLQSGQETLAYLFNTDALKGKKSKTSM